MAWDTSNRRAELPANWQQLRAQAKQRAHGICEHITDGARCTRQGRELHHTGDKHDHSLDMLEWICTECHKRETWQQARAAQTAKYVTARRREPEGHPGTLT